MSKGHDIDMTPDNTYIVSYPNDMLDGILWENDDSYAFISAHTEGYDELLQRVDAMGVGWFSLDEDVNYNEPPHTWVISALCQLVVRTAEGLIV